MSDIEPGDRVRMTESLKAALRVSGRKKEADDFGECVGIAFGPMAYGDGVFGPEISVKWQPSNMRFSYYPEQLDKVTT